MVKNEKGVWYHVTYHECPLCGRTQVYRERRPAPAPPKDAYMQRFTWEQVYDWCDW